MHHKWDAIFIPVSLGIIMYSRIFIISTPIRYFFMPSKRRVNYIAVIFD